MKKKWSKYQMQIEGSLLVAISSFYRGYNIDPWISLEAMLPVTTFLIFSIHIVYERLSVMQKLCPVWKFCCQNHREYPILCKEYPPLPPRNGWTSGKSWIRITLYPKELELLMEDLDTLGFDLTVNTPSLQIHQFLDTFHQETVWYYLRSTFLGVR